MWCRPIAAWVVRHGQVVRFLRAQCHEIEAVRIPPPLDAEVLQPGNAGVLRGRLHVPGYRVCRVRVWVRVSELTLGRVRVRVRVMVYGQG